jgi:hypothetical protein
MGFNISSYLVIFLFRYLRTINTQVVYLHNMTHYYSLFKGLKPMKQNLDFLDGTFKLKLIINWRQLLSS